MSQAFWRNAYLWLDENLGSLFEREGQFGRTLIDFWKSECVYCTAVRGVMIGFAVAGVPWLRSLSVLLILAVAFTVVAERRGGPDAQPQLDD